MPGKVTKEVIDNDDVTRYNGNNPKGAGQGRRAEIRGQKSQKWKRSAWRGRKAQAEAHYEMRYLKDAEAHILDR